MNLNIHYQGAKMSKLITTAVTADRLGVTPQTVARMIDRGELPAYQLPSGAYRIDEGDIDDLLAKSRTQPKELL
jgi:excisionase family DNA binding protein